MRGRRKSICRRMKILAKKAEDDLSLNKLGTDTQREEENSAETNIAQNKN